MKIPDDMAMLRAASELTRDLVTPKPLIYWSDCLLSALIGYAGLAGAILAVEPMIAVLAGVVAVLGLYRAGLFIHELSHIKHSAVPGFRLGWNLLVGIPLLIPSFLYEGLHSLHHARTRYGTEEDPEYLPLALMKPWTVPVFLLVSFLAPVALFFRFGLLGPISFVIPPLRRFVEERYSGLIINPIFRRRKPEGELRRIWMWQEAGATLWAVSVLALVWAGVIPLRAFLIYIAVTGATLFLNQVRTLVAHLWENDGAVLTVTAQFLDSVNVPPPGLLPALWAPVGLRYHAIHHLLPGVPYHALGEAHRRLSATLPTESHYHEANYRSLPGLVWQIIQSTLKPR